MLSLFTPISEVQEFASSFMEQVGKDLYKTAGVPEKTYSLSGELYLSNSGWLLLQVPNAVVRGVFTALDEPGVELPLDKQGNLNAHITVCDPDEVKSMGGFNKIKERGKHFYYSLGPIKTVTPTWEGVSKVWYITVESPDIKKFRVSYGLSPTRKGYDLHITVAIRKTKVLQNNDVSKAASHAEGIPDRNKFTNVSNLTPGQLLSLVIQRHDAERAGRHL